VIARQYPSISVVHQDKQASLCQAGVMPKLRIVKRSARESLGVCDSCNAQFKSWLPQPDKAEWEIQARFDEHKCQPEGGSQTTARIARDAPNNDN